MNNALLRPLRNFSVRLITRRSFVTENLENGIIEKVGISDDAKDSKISMWWNLESCEVPVYYSPDTIIRNISSALRRIHCCGPVEICAYADMRSALSETLIELHNSGVKLRHVPQENKLKDEVMIADIIAWTADHPPPAIHMLMTGYTNYTCESMPWQEVMDQLRVRGYDIIPSKPEKMYPDPYPFPEEMWPWETFLAGPTKSKLEVKCQFDLRYQD